MYKKEILDQLSDIVPQGLAVSIQESLFVGDAAKLKESMEKLLLESVSFYDTSDESFYHGLVLGLCAMMDNRYYVRSNREAGEVRYDIQLMPKVKTLLGILIELKAAKKAEHSELKVLAEAALSQINDRKYDAEMISQGIKEIVKYGAAFCGKEVEIISV